MARRAVLPPALCFQLRATCNVHESAFNDWFSGHLNFQIEHQYAAGPEERGPREGPWGGSREAGTAEWEPLTVPFSLKSFPHDAATQLP